MGNRVAITSPDESLIELRAGRVRKRDFPLSSTGALSGPYNLPYAAGDRLWVREAWRADIQLDEIAPSEMGKYEPRLFISDNQVIEPASCNDQAWALSPRHAHAPLGQPHHPDRDRCACSGCRTSARRMLGKRAASGGTERRQRRMVPRR